jgi:MtN3 and saliva related transmembrane protein
MIRLLGFLAGALTTLAFIPQVVKAWRTGSTADLSLTMLSVFTVGLSLWIVYGVATRQAPVIATNAVTLILALALLALKLGLLGRRR